jgi:hypothetical protein
MDIDWHFPFLSTIVVWSAIQPGPDRRPVAVLTSQNQPGIRSMARASTALPEQEI